MAQHTTFARIIAKGSLLPIQLTLPINRMETKQKIKVISKGFLATILLLVVYATLVSAISGFEFALSQFNSYWYFLSSLAVGFGIQISLYSYLKHMVASSSMTMSGKTVAVTGTTSTLAMISCCAHYLVNIVPILGVAGILSVVAAYQVQIFWIGLLFNIFGIIFISNKIIKFKKHL